MTQEVLESPLARAHFRLSQAFGWTPQEVQQLTMAQVAMYLTYLDA